MGLGSLWLLTSRQILVLLRLDKKTISLIDIRADEGRPSKSISLDLSELFLRVLFMFNPSGNTINVVPSGLFPSHGIPLICPCFEVFQAKKYASFTKNFYQLVGDTLSIINNCLSHFMVRHNVAIYFLLKSAQASIMSRLLSNKSVLWYAASVAFLIV